MLLGKEFNSDNETSFVKMRSKLMFKSEWCWPLNLIPMIGKYDYSVNTRVLLYFISKINSETM